MLIYDINKLSLPQQVEQNRQDIQELIKKCKMKYIVATLQASMWEYYSNIGNNGHKWKYQVACDDVNDGSLVIITPLSPDDYSYDGFSYLSFIESGNKTINIYAISKPPVNIDVKIYIKEEL